jgi:hypothetical protein
MANLGQIKTRIRENVVDDNDELVGRLLGWIQEAQEELEDLHLFPVTRADGFASTAEDTRKLDDLPATWNGIRKDPYYYDGTGATTPMTWLHDSEEVEKAYDALDPLEKGPPSQLFVTDTEIHVYPLPDALAASGDVYAGGNYVVLFPYWKRLTALTGEGESNFFTTTLLTLRFIEERVTARGLLFNRDQEWMVWNLAAGGTLKRIKREHKVKQMPRSLNLAPRRSVNASMKQRRL